MVIEKRVSSSAAGLTIESESAGELSRGDSIAVNGVCLTAARIGGNWFQTDVMPKTFNSTNLLYLKPGDRVNLEPALRVGDPLGGHLVSGHVDGVGKVLEINKEKNAVLLKIFVTKELTGYMAPKGSVAVNGVSLTIQGKSGNIFTVSIIPHTFRQTSFFSLKAGEWVNIEVDMMAKFSSGRNDNASKSEITMAFLAANGFIK